MENTVAVIAASQLQLPDTMSWIEKIVGRFQRLNNIPVRVITDNDVADLPLCAPHYARYYAWRFVPKTTERIIYMDFDVLPVHPLPTKPPDADFAAITEQSRWADSAKDVIPLIGRKKTYFNSGFLIVKRSAEYIFDRMIARQTVAEGGPFVLDQTPLNVEVQLAVELDGLKFELLPSHWCMAFWDMDIRSDPCMVHYISMPEQKLRAIGILVDTLNRLEEQASD